MQIQSPLTLCQKLKPLLIGEILFSYTDPTLENRPKELSFNN